MIFNQDLLETVFSHQTSFMYVLDHNLRVLFASKPLLKHMNKTFEDVAGKTVEEIGYEFATSVKLNKLFSRVLEGHTESGEDIFASVKGIDTYYEYTFAPVKDASGKVIGISCMSRDITDRKRMEAELTQNVAALQKERELREHFIMAMTHDLRTPLTAAKLSAQIIQKHPSDEKAINKFASRIIENVERTDMMIRDLLDSLRLKSGEGITLNKEVCILNALVESLVEELTHIYGQRFQVEMTEMIKGEWDKQAIRRTIDNLLTNAIKYGDPEKTITIKLFKETRFDCISVHNEGEPMNPEEMPNLFLPFMRMKKAKESGQRGWGLGLNLVMGFVDAHGGTVIVDSGADRGTTFTVKLPVK